MTTPKKTKIEKLPPKPNAIDAFLEEVSFDYEQERAKFIANMDMLKNMSVEELTFYKKWCEVKNYRDFMSKSGEVKAKIWRPKNINDLQGTLKEIQELKPRIFYVDPSSKRHMDDWLMLRLFCHTMSYDQTPGRFIRFLVEDETTGQYLGATSISNDVMALTCRDEYIGWTAEDRIGKSATEDEVAEKGKLIHSAIGSCIMGTQPFGYNFLGGKLIATLILSQHVRDTWQNVVGKKLVGMTTTSLYGPNSMYCGIPYWDGCGCSAGKIAIKPDDEFYEQWHDYIKKERAEEYSDKIEKSDPSKGPVTGVKQRILEIIFRELGITASKYNHGFERGVYYATFYDQTKDFLCGKITNEAELTLRKRFDTDSKGMIEWWKKKAINRYTKLHAENRLKPEVLYYNKLIDMSYDQAKKEFFGEVGR